MTVRVLLNREIPECPQRYAGGKYRDDNEDVVDHDDDQENEGGTTDPCKGPNANIEQEDRHLRQPEAKFVEEECIPTDVEKDISSMNDVVGESLSPLLKVAGSQVGSTARASPAQRWPLREVESVRRIQEEGLARSPQSHLATTPTLDKSYGHPDGEKLRNC